MTKPMFTSYTKPSNETWRLSGIRRLVNLKDFAIMQRVLTLSLLFSLSSLGASASYAAGNELFKPLPLDQSKALYLGSSNG
jgi:hypothetical protein